MSLLRILYLHNFSQISGGERSLLQLWANLNRDKFEAFLIIPEPGELSREAEKLGVRVSFLDVPRIHPANFLKLTNAFFQLRAFCQKTHINIIHSHTPRNNILSAFVCKSLGISVIWHERNLIFGNEKDVSRKFQFLADRIICNSMAVARRFEEKGQIPGKVKVILNGVDLNYFTPCPSPENPVDKIVGFVTNLNKRKRVDFFLEAASLINKEYSNVKFLVVGGEFPNEGGKRLAELKDMARSLGLDQKIIFTGFQDDVRPYLNTLDVFVHVTIKEACSRAILEAMSAAKPVVAVNDGGNPELIKDRQTGILVGVNDMKALVDSVVGLLKDDTRRVEMGRKARARAEQFFDTKRNASLTELEYLKN